MDPARPAPGPRPPYGWLALLGVLSGAPYGIVTEALPTVWLAHNVPKAAVTAFVADASWPWTLKFLVGPLADRFGGRRVWIVAGALLCALLSAGIGAVGAGSMDGAVVALVVGLAVVSAVQDVAIDGWAVESLRPGELGPGNGVRVTAWRLSLVVFGGFLAGRSFGLGLGPVLLATAAIFGLVGLAAVRLPDAPRRTTAPPGLAQPFRELLRLPHVGGLVAFVLLFKAGDYAMPGTLTKALVLARGVPKEVLADVLTPVQIGATVLGALAGGLYTARVGIFRALWVLGAFQAGSNLVWAGAAWQGGHPSLYAAWFLEAFSAGLGTAPFLAFLMACCNRANAATHFALWSAVMAFGRWGCSRWSGAAADAVGFAPWFALTFLLALPAYALLPIVRRRLEHAGTV